LTSEPGFFYAYLSTDGLINEDSSECLICAPLSMKIKNICIVEGNAFRRAVVHTNYGKIVWYGSIAPIRMLKTVVLNTKENNNN